jgi:hypothetical protein
MRMSSNSGAPDNKIEFKMLDYSVVDNDDTVSFKLEDGTIVKVKVGIERVGVATNYRNPDGSLHYAVSTSVKLYIIPHDKRFTLQKSQIKGSGASAEQQPPQGEKSLPSHIA